MVILTQLRCLSQELGGHREGERLVGQNGLSNWSKVYRRGLERTFSIESSYCSSEDLGSVSCRHMVALNLLYLSGRESNTLLRLPRAPGLHVVHIHTYSGKTRIHKK